jgi:uncharacterized protein (TIGR03437 family)
MLNRYVFAIALLAPYYALAQDAPTSSIRIYTEPEGARFYVDGMMYLASHTFQWPQGSKHIVQFPRMPDGAYQISLDGNTRYNFNGWTDNNGYLIPGSEAFQTITASPSVTWLKATLTVSYRVMLRFSSFPTGSAPCGAPGGAPQDYLRSGIVLFNGACYGSNADVFLEAGAYTINAFPYPGSVFTGWSVNGSATDPYLQSINVNGPLTVYGAFRSAKRVRFVTDPPGFKVLIDHTLTPTTPVGLRDKPAPSAHTCPLDLSLSQAPPVTILALCYGDFDFVPGSKHVLDAPSPQLDSTGRAWVFSGFSNGLGPNSEYVAGSNVASADLLTAKFVPGVTTTFVTNPPGLRIGIDGREDWPSYNFMWGAGTRHTVTAPETQVDASGRRWTFAGWSDGGAQTREVLVDAANPNARYTAIYRAPGRLNIVANAPGIKFQVDGAECSTPCVIDRPPGTEVSIVAPASSLIDENSRADFLGWSDGQALTRKAVLNEDAQTFTARYAFSYRLTSASDPDGGIDFQFAPASQDRFYPNGTEVMIMAKVRSGFRFRRWVGDLAGGSEGGRLTMSGPRTIIAMLDRVPFISPAGIRNAVGETPDESVAPGSIISIYGESLAPRLEISRRNPLDQTLAGVIVTVGDRMLPLLYVSPQQINAQLPTDLPDGEYTLRVQWDGTPGATGEFKVSRNSPGLFSQPVEDKLYALALHEDGSLVTPDSPAAHGETISIYGSGFGPFKDWMTDGFAFPNPSDYVLLDPVDVIAGGLNIVPVWAGGAPGYVGVAVTRIRITDDLPSAVTLDLSVHVNGKLSNTVLLPIQ